MHALDDGVLDWGQGVHKWIAWICHHYSADDGRRMGDAMVVLMGHLLPLCISVFWLFDYRATGVALKVPIGHVCRGDQDLWVGDQKLWEHRTWGQNAEYASEQNHMDEA